MFLLNKNWHFFCVHYSGDDACLSTALDQQICMHHWAHNCPSPTIYIYIYIYVYSSGTHAQDHKLHVSKKPCAKQMYLRLGALVQGIP